MPIGDLRPAPGLVAASGGGRLRALDFDEHHVLAARGVQHLERRYVVLVAVAIDSRRETVATVAVYLVAGFPVLLAVVGGRSCWRSLRPVEAIRRRVADIGGRHLAARVPVPDSYDEVAQLTATMNSMLDRLQSAHGAQRRFVADASHELRSPLATMRVGLDVAGPHRMPADWPEVHASLSRECDDGPGVSVEERERTFDRFVRLDTSRERARGGSGLGQATVVAHGGSVEVLDAAGGGARFRLYLPIPDAFEE